MECITDFLATNLPPVALTVLIPLIIPLMTTELVGTYLTRYIPRSIHGVTDYENLLSAAQTFEVHLQALRWTRANVLHDWCARAGEKWGEIHSMDVLDHIREILRAGPGRGLRVTASIGAPTWEDHPSSTNSNGSLHGTDQWTWNDSDWVESTSSSAPSLLPSPPIRRKRRRSLSTSSPTSYEITDLPPTLLSLLGTLLQEYTHLPTSSTLRPAQKLYPRLFRDIFSLYRASGTVFAPTGEEIPLRLMNDCFYLAGEVGLIGGGFGEVGMVEVRGCLEGIAEKMDLCGCAWRERYMVRNPFLLPFYFILMFLRGMRLWWGSGR